VVPADSIITEIIAPAPTMPLVQTEPIMIPDIIENGTPVPAPAPTQPDYAFIATLLWLMGMAVMLSVAAVSYVRLKKQVAASLPVKDKVYLCDDIDTPFILGIVRPRIYLPSALDTTLYPSVLLHEYAHLKRRDHWWKPLGYLLLTVHWFNPLVWLGYVLLCRDIELACDEKVIRDMDGQHKKDYSEALLQCSMPRRLITACPLAFGEVGAKQRIKAVLSYKKPAFWVIVIVLVLCAALAVGFLTDPKVTTLGEMSKLTAEDIDRITVNQGGGSARSVTEIEAACEQLGKLELKQVLGEIPFKFDNYITLCPHSADAEYFLWFNEDCTLVYLGRNETQDGKEFYIAEAETYKVVTPEVLEGLLHSEVFYRVDPADVSAQVTIPEDSTQMEFSFSPPALETAITEYLGNKNKNIANLTRIGNVFSDGNTYYTVVSMDYTARDGSVVAENQLYLAQIRWMDGYHGEYCVEGLAKGEWGSSAGYYPNVADFGGQTVIWTTRNDTHAKVFDGGVGSDDTVPNEYDTYRITCASGATYDWKAQNATGVYLLPKGETAVRVAPLYNNKGYEVSAFAFDMRNIETVDVRTLSEQSGLSVFLEMDASTGTILELYSKPVVAESFQGHEALYHALRSNSELIIGDKNSIVLLGQQSYGDYEYAVISYDDHEAVLVEYTLSGDTATLLNYAVGYPPDKTGMRTGYHMNESNMEGGILYWSLYAPRYKVTPNGKDVDESLETVTPDFSGFRFTMRDLKTHDFPADDSFFLCEFTGVIPPSLVTPMEKGKLLAALGSEFSGGLTGTISLQ
ncbi:MAG: M56 family metallopeptidase, partial [Oscillospiraceae bacterium]|nr:M56 family metallopeptidase [Oscillospiraceae bacterium]